MSRRYLEWLGWIPLSLRTLTALTSLIIRLEWLATLRRLIWKYGVTRDGMKPIKNPEKPTKSDEKEMHFNARAKNCLFESFSMDVFNQVFTLNTAHEIWLKLQELHYGISNVRE